MAAFALTSAPVVRDFGRSGYNKDDETKGNKGRNAFNDETPEMTTVDFGRSGYNKDDEDKGNKGRSGYN